MKSVLGKSVLGKRIEKLSDHSRRPDVLNRIDQGNSYRQGIAQLVQQVSLVLVLRNLNLVKGLKLVRF